MHGGSLAGVHDIAAAAEAASKWNGNELAALRAAYGALLAILARCCAKSDSELAKQVQRGTAGAAHDRARLAAGFVGGGITAPQRGRRSEDGVPRRRCAVLWGI